MVNPIKKIYHCFGCGEGGTVFTFVMKMDKVGFPGALENLANARASIFPASRPS
jgi:DNA primase